MRKRAAEIGRILAAFALAWISLGLSIVAGQGWRPPIVLLPPAPVAQPQPEASATPAPAPVARTPLVLIAVNGGGSEVLVPLRDDGGFSAADLQRAAVAFSAQSPGKVHALAPRLLDLVYRSARHFGANTVRVVSGYRSDRAGSRHSQGRAVDMSIDGVENDELAAYLRDAGFVGVGYYPKSGFVHLDVRDASWFWIDDSAPGAPSKLRQVHEEQGRAADAAARARGERPDLHVPNNRREDAAAEREYARRARARREAARRERAAR